MIDKTVNVSKVAGGKKRGYVKYEALRYIFTINSKKAQVQRKLGKGPASIALTDETTNTTITFAHVNNGARFHNIKLPGRRVL